MVLSLVSIALVAAVALAGVYLLTQETITKQETEKKESAMREVLLSAGEGAVFSEPEKVAVDKDTIIVHRAMKDGKEVGAAIETRENGFGGMQEIMVGLDTKGVIIDYKVLKHQETPGLGDHIKEWFKNADKPKQNIIGRQAGSLKVTKQEGDVDGITAATISSIHFLNAINKAYAAYTGSADAHSGASKQVKEEKEADHE